MNPTKRRRDVLALCAVALTAPSLWAQSSDSKPVRLLIGVSAGGSADFIGRTLAEEMGKLLGQTLIVENRPGAGSNIASEAVARAAPDGNTLLLGGSFSHSVNPALFAKMPVDVERDFTSIGKVATLPNVLAVPATLAVQDLREFIAYARREGDKVSFASSGIGSPGHIAGGYLNKFAGLSMTHVPYKGSSESVRALIAGEVQLTITSPTTVMPFVKQGRVRVLALTTAKPSPLVPGVPSAEEAGLKNFNIDGWYGLYGPAGMAPDAVKKLHGALNRVLGMPHVQQKLAAQGAEVDPSPSPEAFTRFGAQDRAKWATIVRDSGARVE